MARDRLRLDLPLPCNESDDIAWGSEGKDAAISASRLLGKPQEGDRKLLLYMAQKMAGTRFRRMEASNYSRRTGFKVDNTQDSHGSGRAKLIRKDSSSTTKGTKQTGLAAQSGGGGDMSNLQEYFSALVVLRNIRRSNPRRDDLFLKFAGRTPAKSFDG